MDRTLYIDAINDTCKFASNTLDDEGIFIQELLDDLRHRNKLTQSEYETLFTAYLPTE